VHEWSANHFLTVPDCLSPFFSFFAHISHPCRFDGYSSPVFARLSMGRVLGDLTSALEDRARGRSPLRLAVYSAHDTSLAGILCALDAFDKRWPPFTSHLTFELLRRKRRTWWWSLSPRTGPGGPVGGGGDGEHFVRLRYNGHTVRLPACLGPEKHWPGSQGEICTLKAFADATRRVSITQEEWERECAR
jgi:acid phosphatase